MENKRKIFKSIEDQLERLESKREQKKRRRRRRK